MRLLATIGYTEFLFAPTANYATLLSALEGAQKVSYDYATNSYKPQGETDLTFKLVKDDDIRLPDVAPDEATAQYRALAEKSAAQELELYTLRRKLADAEKSAAGAKTMLSAAAETI